MMREARESGLFCVFSTGPADAATPTHMLIAVRRPAFALFVPVGFVAIGGGASAASIMRMAQAPSAGGLFGVLVSLGLLAFVLSLVRVMWRAGNVFHVRGLFSRAELSAPDTAFGFTQRTTSRSVEYVIEASDGTRSAECFSVWSRFGAQRCLKKLARVAGDPESPIHVREQARLDRVRAHNEAANAKAKADVMAYYKTPAWRRTVFALLAFVALYMLGMGIFIATR